MGVTERWRKTEPERKKERYRNEMAIKRKRRTGRRTKVEEGKNHHII